MLKLEIDPENLDSEPIVLSHCLTPTCVSRFLRKKKHDDDCECNDCKSEPETPEREPSPQPDGN